MGFFHTMFHPLPDSYSSIHFVYFNASNNEQPQSIFCYKGSTAENILNQIFTAAFDAIFGNSENNTLYGQSVIYVINNIQSKTIK